MKKWTKYAIAALATLLILSGTEARAANSNLIAAWNFEAEYNESGDRYTPMTGTSAIGTPSGPIDPVNIFPGKISGAVHKVNDPGGLAGYGNYYQFSRSTVQEIELTNRFIGLGYDYQDHFNFHILDQFSISVWVKYTNNFDFGSIVSKMITDNDENYRGWCLGAGTAITTSNGLGGIRFHLIHNWQSQAIWVDTKLGYDDGQWHHILATYNGSQSAGGMKIYVDGLEAQITMNGGISNTSEGSAKVMFGNRDSDPNNRQFVGGIDEVEIYGGIFNPGQAIAEFLGGVPVLWLNSHQISLNQGSGSLIQNWNDLAYVYTTGPNLGLPGNDLKEDGIMAATLRQPVFATNALNGYPGVAFAYDYGDTHYGYSDVLTNKYHQEITSGNIDKWSPVPGDKSVFVLFKTGPNYYDDPKPYYSWDGRQTIYEFGGPLSGFNLYIACGKITAGMWNRYQSKYVLFECINCNDDFYPMHPDHYYLAHFEYKAATKEFRLIISRANQNPNLIPPYKPSTKASLGVQGFDGITFDGIIAGMDGDESAIGGASRTRYHDYSTGETYSDHFDGVISEVLMFNESFTAAESQGIYNYLTNKYGLPWTWTYPAAWSYKESEWIVIEKTEPKPEFELSEAVPNPFSERASFRVNIDEAQEIEVELINAVGQKVQSIYSGSIGAGIREFTVDGSQLPQGVYFYRVRGETMNNTGKLILAK